MDSAENSLLVHVLRDHAGAGAVAAAALAWVWPPSFLFAFWAATVFVDLDHYLNLLFWSEFREFRPHRTFRLYANFKKARQGRNPEDFLALELFHTWEFIVILACLVYPGGVPMARPVLAGVLFHVFMDVFQLRRMGATRVRAGSIVEFLWRKRGMERRGIRPTRVWRQAALSLKTTP